MHCLFQIVNVAFLTHKTVMDGQCDNAAFEQPASERHSAIAASSVWSDRPYSGVEIVADRGDAASSFRLIREREARG